MAHHVVNSKQVPLDTRDGCGNEQKAEERLALHYPDHGCRITKQNCRKNVQIEKKSTITVPTTNVPSAPEKATPNDTGLD
jgi:hypothetical protein